MNIVPIQKALLLDGARRFNEGNVNATYRGQILLANGSIKSAIVKDLVNRELGIELLVAALGKLLGLPIPNAYLAVSNKPLGTSVGPTLSSGHRLLFASEDAASPPVVQIVRSNAKIEDRILKRLASIESVHSLFSFDTWTANTDRHAGNLLLSPSGVWFIDHGHCFGGPQVEFTKLDAMFHYPQKITNEIATVLTSEQKQRVVEKCGKFPSESEFVDAQKILSKGDVEAILGPDDFSITAKFLSNRRAYVPKLGSAIVGVDLLA